MVDVFISHSGEDHWLVSQLVDLLRTSLKLSARQIRCTSLDGYRLPAGADTDEQLREEALEARALIAVLSPFSLASPYVLFELGARWGAKRPFIPLLAPGIGYQSLRGPLRGFNAITCETAAELHQLVSDVRRTLDIEAESPEVYQRQIDAVVYSGHSPQIQDTPPQPETSPSDSSSLTADRNEVSPAHENDYSDAEQVIHQHCESEWPEDYNMRNYCTKQQRQALAILKQGRPEDIPDEVFAGIRSMCAAEWPKDYGMRQYCEKQQFDSYRELERGPE